MLRPIHFEINADNPERAAKFYAQVFGWKINKWEGPVDYWLAITGESGSGIDGAVKWRSKQSLSTVITIEVPSVDEFLAKIEQNGGRPIISKMAIPGIGFHAYCLDTEGNVIGIMQNDPSAR